MASPRNPVRPAPTLSAEQQTILDAYFGLRPDDDLRFSDVCDELGVPDELADISRVRAAAGQVLVRAIQYRLPQWASVGGGKIVLGRALGQAPATQTLAFLPLHLFTINWADSGPGISWPEAYNMVYAPTHERFAVVASQDSPDMWGCTDQAIGHFADGPDKLTLARKAICEHWAWMRDEVCQQPWAYLFTEGLVSEKEADQWRRRIWPESEYEYPDDEPHSAAPALRSAR